jgi:hypothetical protein
MKILEVMVNKIFEDRKTITRQEFNQIAGQKLKLKKEDTRILISDLKDNNLIETWGKKQNKITNRNNFYI